jgi:hypothetical protein
VTARAHTGRVLRDDAPRRLQRARFEGAAREAWWMVEEASGLQGADLVAD